VTAPIAQDRVARPGRRDPPGLDQDHRRPSCRRCRLQRSPRSYRRRLQACRPCLRSCCRCSRCTRRAG
jgi:hypothetical protein